MLQYSWSCTIYIYLCNVAIIKYLNTFWIFFQELLVILFFTIMVVPFQLKIMIIAKETVLWLSKEPGGTSAVINLTWMDFTVMGSIHLMPMESTGVSGRDITTPSRELRWKLDQPEFHFRTSYFVSISTLFIVNFFFINHNSLKQSYRNNENDCVLYSKKSREWAGHICPYWFSGET